MMVDYLASLTTPVNEHCPREEPSPIQSFIAGRVAQLDDPHVQILPVLTPAGPVDLSADLAVLFETLYHRRLLEPLQTASILPVPRDAEMDHHCSDLDEVLRRVHWMATTSGERSER
jgi:hypothetical protein